METIKSGIPRSYLSTDGTMAANSDVKVPTEKAIVTYVAATAAPATAIDAADIADGSVTNTEFQYIGGLTSDAQDQLDLLDSGKVDVVMSALGDVMYGGAAGAETRLAGNTTTTPKALMQTGDGAASAAPAWTAAGTTAATMAAGNDSRFGYLICGHQASQNPADSSTYYFGANFNANWDTNSGRLAVSIPFTGTVTKIMVTTKAAGASGAEAELSTLNFRYDDTADTLITDALSYVSTNRQIITATVSIAVTAGHYFEFKLTTPAWATNPTGVWFNYQVFVQVP